MVGGVLFEHGHRLAAATVGCLTVVLAIWTVVRESRPAVRALGTMMLFAVVMQGVLGGVTVLYKLPLAVSVSHACLAQIFFCLAVSMAVVTGPSWTTEPARPVHATSPLALLAAVTTVATFGQVLLGALVRHTGAGLAIPDFPLAFGRLVPPLETSAIAIHFAHRVGAAIVTILVTTLVGNLLLLHRDERRLTRLALLASALVMLQIGFGALIIWTHRAVVPTTTHLVIGAGILATCVGLTLEAMRAPLPSARPHELPHAVPA
jgi:cytochrome c oxidase assembly protein subunit 15